MSRVKPTNPVVNRSHPLARGLVGAWAFQDGGGTTLRDVSGHGLDGTITGAAWTTDRYGSALEFDRVNDDVNLGSSVVDGVRTVAFTWTFPNGWSSSESVSAGLWSRTNGSTNDDQFMCSATYLGNIDFYKNDGSTLKAFRTTQSTWAAGRPYHFVFVIDPVDGFKLYIDGVREVPNIIYSTTAAVVADSYDLYLGIRSNDAAQDGVGICSDFRLWSRALKPSEVLDLYVGDDLYSPAVDTQERYYRANAPIGAIGTGLHAIEAGGVYGAPGINSGLHAIGTGVVTA